MHRFNMMLRLEQPQQIFSAEGKEIPKAEAYAAYQAGDRSPISFVADVYSSGQNKNHTILNEAELESFAASFAGQPFLKDHAREQDSRGGTIRESKMVEVDGKKVIRQLIEVVKPWAKEGYLDGTIDRFSIGWDAEEYLCTVCKTDFFGPDEKHAPWDIGLPDKKSGKTVEILMKGLEGTEVSAVTHPAVSGTGIREQLMAYKETIIAKPAKVEEQLTRENTAETGGKEMLDKLVARLGLSAGTAEEAALTELDKRLASPQTIPTEVFKALGMDPAKASFDEVICEILSIKAPGGMVTKEEYAKMVGELNEERSERLVREAEDSGKVTPDMRTWALEFAKRDHEGFKKWAGHAKKQIPAPVPFVRESAGDTKPESVANSLSEIEERVRRSGSLTVEQFLAAKKRAQGVQ